MVEIDQSRKIAIMGDSGSGKTTLMLTILRELSKYWDCYVYNTDYETFPDIKSIIPLTPNANYVDDPEYLSLIINRLRAKYNNFVFVVTDLDKFFESTSSTSGTVAGLKDLYGTGRHQRILVIMESKQPRYIPSKTLANSNLFYIGKFTEVEDVWRLRNYANEEDLNALHKYEFIEYDKWTGERHIVKVDLDTNEIVYLDKGYTEEGGFLREKKSILPVDTIDAYTVPEMPEAEAIQKSKEEQAKAAEKKMKLQVEV